MIATKTYDIIMTSSQARDDEITTSATRSIDELPVARGSVCAPSTAVRVVQYPRQRRRLRIGGSAVGRRLVLVYTALPRCRR